MSGETYELICRVIAAVARVGFWYAIGRASGGIALMVFMMLKGEK